MFDQWKEGRQGHKGSGKKKSNLAFRIYFKMWYSIRILMALMIEVLVVEPEMVGCVFYTIKGPGFELWLDWEKRKKVRSFTVQIHSLTALVLQWICHCRFVIYGISVAFFLFLGSCLGFMKVSMKKEKWCPMRLRSTCLALSVVNTSFHQASNYVLFNFALMHSNQITERLCSCMKCSRKSYLWFDVSMKLADSEQMQMNSSMR